MAAVHHAVEGAVEFLGTRLYAGADLSVALFSLVSSSAFESRRSFSSGVSSDSDPHANLRLCPRLARRRSAAGFTPSSWVKSVTSASGHGGRWCPHPLDDAEDHHRWIVWRVQDRRWRSRALASNGAGHPLRYVAMVVAGLVVLTFLFTGARRVPRARACWSAFLALVAFFSARLLATLPAWLVHRIHRCLA